MNNEITISELECILKKKQFCIIYDLEFEELLLKMVEIIEKSDKQIEILTCCRNCSGRFWVRCISYEQMKMLKKQFHLYELTNKIIMISDAQDYPNMLNYVKQGILTKDEFLDALLYKIG